MLLTVLKSKLHLATITSADLHYQGSLAIDLDIMEKVGLLPYEKILVANVNNGERLETYAIPAERGSKIFLLNGAAAHKGRVGDRVIIMSFVQLNEQETKNWNPKMLVLDEANNIINAKHC